MALIHTMKILSIISPYIPSYFNLGHHLPVFQISAYLRHHLKGQYKIKAIDGAALNYQWKNVADLLVEKYNVIVLINDFDGVDTFERLISYARKFSPTVKIITVGRLSMQIPSFFLKNYNIDASVYSGDYEASVLSYIKYIKGDIPKRIGVQLKDMNTEEVIVGT